MAKKIEIELDVTGNVVESTKNLKAMKQELKGLDVGSAEFKKLFNEIDDLEDKIKSAKGASSDWVDSLESAGGPLGMVGAGINKVKVATQSFGAALKATGIGLVVAAIGGLVAAFSQTEGSMKKLEPLLIGLEKIFGGIVEGMMPLIDMFMDLAMKALPYVVDGIKIFYGSLMGLFTLVKEAGTGVGKILKGIFTLDTKSLEEGYNQLKGSWDKTKESFNQFTDNFEKGYAKQTKTQKENAKNSQEIADKALAEKLKNMEALDKIDQATLEKMKAEALALATTEQQKLDIEKTFAKKSYDLKKQELEDKQKLYKKDSNEYKSYTADLLKLDADYINTKTGNDQKQKELDITKRKEFFEKDKAIYQSQVDERQRNQSVANEKELQELDLKLKKGQIKEYQYQQELYLLKQRQLEKTMTQLNFSEQQEKMHYENLYNIGKINKEDYENKLLELTKVYGDKRVETLKLQGDNEFTNAVNLANMLVATKEYEKQAIIALEEAKISAIATLGGILSQLANGNKDIAILGLAISQGAAIADILTKYFRTKATLIFDKATYMALIPNPITAPIGIAGVAATTAGMATNTIGMVTGLAGVASAVAQGIAAINGGGNKASGGGGATPNMGRNYEKGGMLNGPRHAQGGMMIEAEGGEAVMTRGAVTMFNPLLSMMNQMGGGVAFNKGATGQASYDNPNTTQVMSQPQIIKTYVVSSEMTNEQQRQARLKDLSTL
jgi:hypothetical protein